jgi:hypothetical protein
MELLKMRFSFRALFILICLTVSSFQLRAETTVDTSRVQAAFVYNFMLLAKWSQDSRERVLCTAGQNRDSLALKSLDGREINDAHIKVVALRSDENLSHCHALFVASTEYSHLFDRALGKSVLVISNVQPDNGRVAAIMLYSVGSRVVFDVDFPALSKSNVHLAASVLRLARDIRE